MCNFIKSVLNFFSPKNRLEKPVGNGPKIKALVVDDNPLNAKLIEALLKKLDCAVNSVANGQEAIDQIRNQPCDICFMDIQMPVMDGIEATKIIREEISQDMPVIAVTAISDFTYEKSIEAGMNDYLRKPVDLPSLERVLSKFLHKAA